jgi:hypothetical protein
MKNQKSAEICENLYPKQRRRGGEMKDVKYPVCEFDFNASINRINVFYLKFDYFCAGILNI